jgi:flagellar biosynthetic protein FliQ
MDTPTVISIARDFFWTALLLVGPTVAVSLLVGLLISIFQTVTSIQEQTLTFAPRIVAVGAVICITLPWSLSVLMDFTERLFANILQVTQ